MQRAVFIYDKLGNSGNRFNAIARSESLGRFITVTQPFGVIDSATDPFVKAQGHSSPVTSFYGVSLSPRQRHADGQPVPL